MDKLLIAKGIQLVLDGLGVDKTDHNFFDTPQRYAKAMEEIFAQPERVTTAFDEAYTDFILVRGHEMYTLCPHHLLPVRMLVSVAYIPDGRVLGLSKLVRIMQQANSGPIMQERFTNEVRSRLEKALEAEGEIPKLRDGSPRPGATPIYNSGQNGIAVHVEGWHGCMQMRGVRSNASTITTAFAGKFETEEKWMERFMLQVAGRR